jgi:hypothetical protein
MKPVGFFDLLLQMSGTQIVDSIYSRINSSVLSLIGCGFLPGCFSSGYSSISLNRVMSLVYSFSDNLENPEHYQQSGSPSAITV